MPDMSVARLHMVEGQVRTNDVTDTRITELMSGLERERFVPVERRNLAYSDMCVELKPGRFLTDPRSFAKLVQALEITSSDRVLDIACGTGYSSAVLAGLSADVTALEEDEELVKFAAPVLRSCKKLGRLNGVVGSHKAGAPAHAPYDVIFVNGAVEEIPPAWIDQLKEGGRMGVIIKSGAVGSGYFCVRKNGVLGRRVVFDATVPVLPGCERAPKFVFQ